MCSLLALAKELEQQSKAQPQSTGEMLNAACGVPGMGV
ncbi:MbeB family mobilization protein [Enterobacter hormaechei]|nr:MbeB family mobilization protein [Enterobacter hormaechei]MDS0012509.1 hypothetical protein [Enterobacter hormaechei subsp. xiangfangensis]